MSLTTRPAAFWFPSVTYSDTRAANNLSDKETFFFIYNRMGQIMLSKVEPNADIQ